MNKSIKKTMATLLIAAFMISILTVVMLVGALSPTGMYTSGDATVELSGERKHSGIWSYKHVATGEFDEASIFFNYGDTLGSITSISYWSYVLSGESGELHPYVYLTVDTGSDDIADAWVVQWEVSTTDPSGLGMWIQTTFDDSTLVHVPGGPAGYGQPATKTLGDLKEEPGWSGYTVLEVFVELGQFTGAETITAFIDDVNINGLLYDFENVGPVSITGESRDPKTSISVSTASIDFGEIVLGQVKDVDDVTITNNGETDASITAELMEDDGFYATSLRLDGDEVGVWSETITVGGNHLVDLTLDVPRGADPGVHTAILVFWAEETP